MFSARMKKKGICGPNNALTHKSNQVQPETLADRLLVKLPQPALRVETNKGYKGLAYSPRIWLIGC
eukprot:935579-Pelagomonas_calceolata.AAC.1